MVGMGTELREEVEITGGILCVDIDTVFLSEQFGFGTLEKPSQRRVQIKMHTTSISTRTEGIRQTTTLAGDSFHQFDRKMVRT